MEKEKSIVREVTSTTLQENSKANYNGWNLVFTVQKSGDEVRSVNVIGQKENMSINISKSETGYVNIGCSAYPVDTDLINKVVNEIEEISKSSIK